MSRNLAVFLSLILLATVAAYAQEVRASITGIVSDPSSAPVAGATVTVTNLSTNAAVVTQTNETGSYTTPFLAPGTYTLSVEQTGFRKYVQENIVLQALDRARTDVQLQLGTLSDSVTVSASAVTLQTETASRGQTISNEMIENVPTQGRNPFQIAWAAPGVVKSGGWRYLRSFDIGGTSGFSVNGGRNQENEVLLDGISNVQSSRTVIHVPTMDSVQEFKVQTNTYDAQYGRTGGGIVTIVTKSGTNQIHGIAYEYFQNDKLNANQTELNAANIKKSPNHINAFGFEAAGPVYIPKVADARNKLFWMLAYEGMRQRSADPGIQTVPQVEWRGGDFSTLFNAQGQQVVIYDPLTTQKDGTRTPFAGNQLPSNRISKFATEAFKYYPAPTSAGLGPAHIQNYPYPSRWIGDLDQWIGRMDYNINSKNIVYFRYGQNPYSEYRGLVFITDPSQRNPAEPTGNAPLIRNGRNWTFDWTSTLSPTHDVRPARRPQPLGGDHGQRLQHRFRPAHAGGRSRAAVTVHPRGIPEHRSRQLPVHGHQPAHQLQRERRLFRAAERQHRDRAPHDEVRRRGAQVQRQFAEPRPGRGILRLRQELDPGQRQPRRRGVRQRGGDLPARVSHFGLCGPQYRSGLHPFLLRAVFPGRLESDLPSYPEPGFAVGLRNARHRALRPDGPRPRFQRRQPNRRERIGPQPEGSGIVCEQQQPAARRVQPRQEQLRPAHRSGLPAGRQVGTAGRLWLVLPRPERHGLEPGIQPANQRGRIYRRPHAGCQRNQRLCTTARRATARGHWQQPGSGELPGAKPRRELARPAVALLASVLVRYPARAARQRSHRGRPMSAIRRASSRWAPTSTTCPLPSSGAARRPVLSTVPTTPRRCRTPWPGRSRSTLR